MTAKLARFRQLRFCDGNRNYPGVSPGSIDLGVKQSLNLLAGERVVYALLGPL